MHNQCTINAQLARTILNSWLSILNSQFSILNSQLIAHSSQFSTLLEGIGMINGQTQDPDTDSKSGLIFNIQKFSLHDGAGIRTCVFFQGCNMRCKWCSNPESHELQPPVEVQATVAGRPAFKVKPYRVDELMEELVKDKPFYDASDGGVTLTGGEPLLQPLFAGALCAALRAAGISTALETAGNVDPEVFETAIKHFDALHIDLKHYDDEAHRSGTGVGNALIITNIGTALASGIRTIIRIPVIPGYNDSPADIAGFSALLRRLGAPEVHLLPFHRLGEGKYLKMGLKYDYAGAPQLHEDDLIPFAEALREIVGYVQIGG